MTATANLLWSVEAEQSVLGSVMIEPDSYRVVMPLTGAHFNHRSHRAIWVAIETLERKGRAIDAVSVCDALGAEAESVGGLEYLNELVQSVPSGRNAGRYAEIVRERAARRELAARLDEALESTRAGVPVQDVLAMISSVVTRVATEQTTKSARKIGDIALERTDHYERVQAKEIQSGWPTHIPAIDRALAGGARPGKVYFIAARPSVGKTSLAQQVSMAMAKDGHEVLMLSQEMEDVELADRAISNIGRVDGMRLQGGDLSESDWERTLEAVEQLSDLPFWVDDQGALTGADIENKAMAQFGHGRGGVLIVDYLQLCAGTPGSSAANRNSEIEEISRGLKALAKRLGLAVFVLSQLNREVERRVGKRPVMSDLRDSGSIEQDADVILMLWSLGEAGGIRSIGAALEKNRGGPKIDLVLAFNGAHQRWSESTATVSSFSPTATPKARHFDD